jgi:predicted transcriptional regulator of viral defense system
MVAGMRNPADLRLRLTEVAARQGGLFTAAQARDLGYDYPQHTFHTARGNWLRVDRGLYRLPHWPIDRHDDLIQASLWARGRGVVSHESAAAVHELAEIDPLRTHLTVPPRFRSVKRAVVLHHLDDLRGEGIEDHGGFRVTTPLRTLIDLGRSSTDLDQLGRAIVDALDRHLLGLADLRRHAQATDVNAALAIEHALLERDRS